MQRQPLRTLARVLQGRFNAEAKTAASEGWGWLLTAQAGRGQFCQLHNLHHHQLFRSLMSPQQTKHMAWMQRRGFQSFSSPRRGYRQGMDGDTAVKALIGINLAGWVLWQSNPTFMKRNTMVSYESLSNLRLHTLVTSAFSHYDGWHLFSNMFALYFFGQNTGALLGGKRLIHMYVAGAIVSSLAHVGAQWWQARSSAYRSSMPGAIGASGAVNALVIFSILLQPTATVLIYGIIPLPAFMFGALWLFYDLRGAVTQAPGIAYAGHLGGASVGALCYLAVRRRLLR